MRWTLLCAAIFYSYSAWGNPTGPHVMHDGNAQISNPSINICHIQTQDQVLVIHWNDFSIRADELTRFIQPSDKSVVLNRVIGDACSEIYGSLQANGQLLLLNQNGILFGENAVINTGALIASTLNLSDEDFLKGATLHFKGPSRAAIINHGTIHASSGNVTLLSRHILNTGVIQSPQGNTELACGSEILLKPHGKNHILIRPQFDKETIAEGILHQGQIKAIETHLLADGNLYDYAIKDDGEIDALTIEKQGGRVFLCAENGTLAVSGKIHAPGGQISLLADNILVLDSAHLSASDLYQSGSIHLGKGESYTSAITFVAEEARLEANALKLGHGGEIICWSDGTTLFLGHAESRGGLLGGDGGFIEVSGKKSMIFQGTTDRFAPLGESGHLLLDPEANLKISTAYNYNYESILSLKKPTSDLANLTIDTLIAELNKGPVTIQTAYDGDGGALGHILIHSDISHVYDSPHALSFQSSGEEGIIWNGSLVNTGTGAIELFTSRGDVQFTPANSDTPAFIQTAGNLTIGTLLRPIQGKIDILGAHQVHAGLKTTGNGQLSIYAQQGLALVSDKKAPAFIQVENGSAHIKTSGPLLLHGRHHAPAEIRSRGEGNLSIIGPESIHLLGDSGQALISFSHRFGHLFIHEVKKGIELNAKQDTAAIEGGIGSITITHIGSDITLFAEQAPAFISSYGPVTLQTLGDVHLDAFHGDATIQSNFLLQITSKQNLIVNADQATASLISPTGMHLHALKDILLNGTSQGQAYFKSPSSHIFAGHNLEFFTHTFISGESGPLHISVGNDLLMSNPLQHTNPRISSAELQVNIGRNLHLKDQTSIAANCGALHLSVGETAYLDHSSHLSSTGGALYLTSLQGNIHLTGKSEVLSTSDCVTLSAGKSIIFDGFSKAKSHGDRGMTLIVDHLRPTSIGNGGFILAENASIETSNAPLEIYTGRRSNNVINGTLNGFRKAAAPLYISTKEEQWGAFYPTSFDAIPFTVFHKENGLIQISPQEVTQKEFSQIVVNFTGPFTAELFRNLHAYDEYTTDSISFTVTYLERVACEMEPFSIKRRTFPYRFVPSIKKSSL